MSDEHRNKLKERQPERERVDRDDLTLSILIKTIKFNLEFFTSVVSDSFS